MSKHIVIVGGGIIGLSTAYYLQKEGCQVTVIDKTNMDAGASYVNAGYVSPSHIIPLAAPGVVAQGLKWMFNSSSPFYMKPRWDIDFFKWLWFFQKSANPNKVKYAIPIIKDITLFSRELYQDIYNSGDLGVFQWERKGILMMYKTDVAGEEEIHTSKLAKGEGLEVNELNLQQLKKMSLR